MSANTFTRPLTKRLADVDAEDIRRNTQRQLAELQALPASGIKVIRDVVLPNATNVTVAHKLGREPIWVGISAPRGAAGFGSVIEITGLTTPQIDRTQIIVLQAGNYAATVTVDVMVL